MSSSLVEPAIAYPESQPVLFHSCYGACLSFLSLCLNLSSIRIFKNACLASCLTGGKWLVPRYSGVVRIGRGSDLSIPLQTRGHALFPFNSNIYATSAASLCGFVKNSLRISIASVERPKIVVLSRRRVRLSAVAMDQNRVLIGSRSTLYFLFTLWFASWEIALARPGP